MMRELRIEGFGTIKLSDGLPAGYSAYILPQALTYHASGPWGLICLQEIETKKFLLRHFFFSLQNTISFYLKERDGRLQFLLSLKGHFEHKITGQESNLLKDKEFLLFSAANQETKTTAYSGKMSSILNAEYTAVAYKQFLPYFQNLKKDSNKAFLKAHYLTPNPIIARHTVHDSINAIWADRYIPSLTIKHIELRLESSLFTLLAQSYNETQKQPITHLEKEIAVAAHQIILHDITVHKTPEQIATELFCSAAWLKKAYSKVYGIGMFHSLRKTRMELAKEMLLRGESLKAVAIEVGMKPSNFPKEFKAFFGYTVTDLKKGQV